MSVFAQFSTSRAKARGRLVAALGLPILAAVLLAGGQADVHAAHNHLGAAASIAPPFVAPSGPNAPRVVADVTIQGFAFSPNSVTINVGDTVRWTNNDGATHTATSDPGAPVAFNTGNLTTGQQGSITFNTPGTYNYHCAIHSSMMATLIVQGGGATATATGTTAPTATRTATVVPTVTTTATLAPPTATTTATTAPPTTTRTATVTVPAGTVTATVTGTPPTATITATATTTPNNTATATVSTTATPCAIHFTDVTDPSAYYYTAVYYLACRGVVSGYNDGTFLPFNNTTRGQMAKIVVLAYQIPVNPPDGGTFADVPSNSVFYGTIEAAAAHNIISGYTCGGSNPQTGASEPCDSGHRPYYRPNNNVTRGQLTKIVVIGAGWMLLNPATPSFTDVDRQNVFYPFIQTAVCHGIISGYNDSTFRPNNFAFRGQIAKIVYLAVTYQSGCNPNP